MDSQNVSTFRNRILRAGGWTFAGHLGNQILRLASNLLMTRLLLPQMFGVMAIANVLLTGLQLFSDIGLGQGIIQSKRGSDVAYLNTVWTAQILRGALICLAALLIALGLVIARHSNLLPSDTVYSEPRLPALIAVLSLNAILGGLVSTRVATASRNLALGRITLMELSSQSTAIIVMVGWAQFDRSAWALVAGSVISSILRLILSHTYLPGEPNRLHWDNDAFRDIFTFGKWIFLTSILGFLAANGDRLLLGALVDAHTLGIYVIAYFMVSALMEVFSKVCSNVAYPALSEVVRERPADLLRTYYKFRMPIDVASLFAAGFMFSAGHLIVRVLYDRRYQAAGHMMEILSISLLEARYALAGTSLMALGKPKLLVPVLLIQLAVLATMMPIMFHFFGLDAALWIIGGSVLCTIPITLVFKSRYGLLDWRREVIYLPFLVIGYIVGTILSDLASRFGGLT